MTTGYTYMYVHIHPLTCQTGASLLHFSTFYMYMYMHQGFIYMWGSWGAFATPLKVSYPFCKSLSSVIHYSPPSPYSNLSQYGEKFLNETLYMEKT